MGLKEQAFTLLTEQATGAAGTVITLAITTGAKLLWKGIKDYYTKHKEKLPPKERIEVVKTDSGGEMMADSLKDILSMVPEENLRELLREASSISSGHTEIHGRDFIFDRSNISGGTFTVNNISSPPPDHHADAMNLLKRKQYDNASVAFEGAVRQSPDSSEVYFYAAVCLLKGKPAFVTLRPEIDRIENHIDTALTIERKAIYYYFQAYIKYDYFERKCFNTSPTWRQALSSAKSAGLSRFDVQKLYKTLDVPCPACLQIR